MRLRKIYVRKGADGHGFCNQEVATLPLGAQVFGVHLLKESQIPPGTTRSGR